MAQVIHREGAGDVQHHIFDGIEWPLMATSVAVWPIWSWTEALWEHAPTPTALYMVISAGFMLFQMFDKLGWLHRFKRTPLTEPPEKPD